MGTTLVPCHHLCAIIQQILLKMKNAQKHFRANLLRLWWPNVKLHQLKTGLTVHTPSTVLFWYNFSARNVNTVHTSCMDLFCYSLSTRHFNLSKKNVYTVTPSQWDVSTKSAFIFYRLKNNNKKKDLTQNHHPMTLLCMCKVTEMLFLPSYIYINTQYV
jgi:hypothetical protein